MSDSPTTEQVTTAAPTEMAKSWSMLASESFGDNFKGEVNIPKPEQAKAESSESAPEVAEPAESTTETTAETTSEESTISSIAELVERYELDAEWLDTLEIPVKINGAEGKAKLSDLKKNYQITEAAEQRLEEAKNRAKAETQVIAEKREQLKSQFSVVAEIVGQAEKMIKADYAGVNWNELRVNDPAEYSAKKTEMAERQAELESLKAKAISSYQNTMQAAQQESEIQMQAYVQEQQQMLLTKLPEWKDPEVAKADKLAVANYLKDTGFTQEDIASATDHRMILLARKAMLYDKGQNKAEVAKKKVVNIPKVLKPGAPKSTDQINSAKIAQLQAKSKQSGSVEDAVALLRSKRGR